MQRLCSNPAYVSWLPVWLYIYVESPDSNVQMVVNFPVHVCLLLVWRCSIQCLKLTVFVQHTTEIKINKPTLKAFCDASIDGI